MTWKPYPSGDEQIAPSKPELIAIARILKTRGLRGEVVARALTEYPDRFAEVEDAYIDLSTGELLEARLAHHWFHQGRLILQFAGYESIERAEKLIGGVVNVEIEQAVELQEDEFFHFQLADCRVLTTGGVSVGVVVSVMDTAGPSLLVVRDADDNEHLIPFVKSICPEVNIAAKEIRIDPPDGLLDL